MMFYLIFLHKKLVWVLFFSRLLRVCDLVNEVDPKGATLSVQDTDTDIKIYLKSKLSGQIFNKGHGLRLFAREMKLDLKDGNILVCADSETDLPMLQEVCLKKNVFKALIV